MSKNIFKLVKGKDLQYGDVVFDRLQVEFEPRSKNKLGQVTGLNAASDFDFDDDFLVLVKNQDQPIEKAQAETYNYSPPTLNLHVGVIKANYLLGRGNMRVNVNTGLGKDGDIDITGHRLDALSRKDIADLIVLLTEADQLIAQHDAELSGE